MTRWSTSATNVWQRVMINTSTTGTWTMRLKGTSVPSGPQRVYLLLHTRLPSC